MCEKCNALRRTEIGYKTKVKIAERTEMVLDRYKNHFDVFIHTSFTGDVDGRWYNDAFDFTHCPFCGEEIIPYGKEKGQE